MSPCLQGLWSRKLVDIFWYSAKFPHFEHPVVAASPTYSTTTWPWAMLSRHYRFKRGDVNFVGLLHGY